jgi:hypothetical protein
MKKFKNRYGDEYWYNPVSADTVRVEGDLGYWRFGGREGQEGIVDDDLGFVDPSGGPFITLGSMVEGRRVVRIRSEPTGIYLDLELQ